MGSGSEDEAVQRIAVTVIGAVVGGASQRVYGLRSAIFGPKGQVYEEVTMLCTATCVTA